MTIPILSAWGKLQPLGRSAIRGVLSLALHGAASFLLWQGTRGEPSEVLPVDIPLALAAFLGIAVTYYFATNEEPGNRTMPAQQRVTRFVIRSTHAMGATGFLIYLLVAHEVTEFPTWWVTVYASILTFYFVELTTGVEGRSGQGPQQ